MAGVSQSGSEGTGGGDSAGSQLLVIAAEVVGGAEVRGQVERRVSGSGARVHVVAPALTEGALAHAMGDVDDAAAAAQQRLDASLEELAGIDAETSGAVGDSDPLIAIEDALQTFSADEILIVTHPEDEGRWLEDDVFERAKAKFEPPLTHVVAERDDSGSARVTDVERSGQGVDAPDDAEVDPTSGNQPRFSARDIAGLLVALVGTIVLVVLAGDCEGGVEEGSGTPTECVIRILIAGAVGLVNAAHMVGLLLFQSVGYRGGWERFFALMSLVITPLAIVASLLIH